MRTLHVKVSGVTFDNRQEYLERLIGDEPVRLMPEPTNKYDPNAIAVQIAVDGDVLHCGYIPKEIAAKIAPLMDGESFMASIEAITGGFEIDHGEYAAYGLRLKVELPDENIHDGRDPYQGENS